LRSAFFFIFDGANVCRRNKHRVQRSGLALNLKQKPWPCLNTSRAKDPINENQL